MIQMEHGIGFEPTWYRFAICCLTIQPPVRGKAIAWSRQALWLHKTPDLRRESLRLSILCSKQAADNTANDRTGSFSGQALVIPELIPHIER